MLRAYKALRPAAGFLVDEPPTTHSLTAELFATVKSDGRIGEHTRLAVGGRDLLEGEFQLGLLFDDPQFQKWSIVIQRRPLDLDLRRGLLSGGWHNLSDWVASRDASVIDADGAGVSAASFLKLVHEADGGPEVAAVRWAVVLSDCAKLQLQLQGMPATAATLSGKPALKR